jgi:iron complex outermembrane receptor protein
MNETIHRGRTASVLGSALLGLGAGAGAGVALAADSTPGAGDGSQLDEVIVTAERRAETAIKTPLALTVISGAALQDKGVVSVFDLQNVAPAVSVGRGAFGVTLAIRGVTTADNTSKGDQGIAFNVDNIPISRPSEMGLAFFDLERIEVLRGPQGTLYGKSSTGGVINLVTNKPKDAFDASASVELGNYKAKRADIMVNMPVTSQLAVRAAVNFNQRDGYLNPVIGNTFVGGTVPARNEQSDWSTRLSGLWDFNDSASLLVTGTFGHLGGAGPANALYNSVNNKSGSVVRDVYYNPFGSQLDQDFHNYNAELNLELGPVHITYDGGYLLFDANDRTSSTNNPLGNQGGRYNWRNYRGDVTTTSHELRLSNAGEQRLEWVLGANHYDEDINESDHNWNAPIANPTLAGSANGIDPLNNTVHTSSGVFGQINFHATDALKLTLGLRRSSDEVVRRGTFAAGPGPWLDPTGVPCVAPNDCVGGRNDGDQSANKTTYRAGVDYQIATNHMIYASVATGYKAGGFNDFDPRTNSPSAYIPEELLAYEAGYKATIRPNLQFTSSAYYYDYSKAQVASTIVINGSNVSLTNILASKVYGLENELTWNVNEANSLEATLTLAKSEYGPFRLGPGQSVDWTGDDRDKTPKLAASLGYAHRWFAAGGAVYEARLSSRYSGDYFVSDFPNAVHYTQDSFTRTDQNLNYASASGKIELEAYVRNIEDELQMVGAPGNVSATVLESANMSVSEPMTLGVRATVRF